MRARELGASLAISCLCCNRPLWPSTAIPSLFPMRVPPEMLTPPENLCTPSPEGFSSDPETADVVPSPQFGQSIAPPVPGTPGHRAHLGREKAEVQDRRKKKKKKGAPVWKGAIGKQRTVVTSPASTGFRVPCFSGSQSPLLYNKKVGLKQWCSLECVLEDL